MSRKSRKPAPASGARDKRAIQELVRQGRLEEARRALQEYMREYPRDIDVFTLTGVILLLEDRLEEAERALLQGLEREPNHCDLLFNLGYLDEQRQEYVSALDLYKRAEVAAASREQEDDIARAVHRVSENIRGQTVFKEDGYVIALQGNSKPVVLQYNLPRLVARKELLDAVIRNLDAGTRSILEVECPQWLLPKNLSDLGFQVQAWAPELQTILQALAVEFQEKLRALGTPPPRYYVAALDAGNADRVPESDTILLLPRDQGWYQERGLEAAGRILAALARRARRQLFFLVPGGEAAEDGKGDLPPELQGELAPGRFPQTCWTGPDGSRLLRLDTVAGLDPDPEAIIPSGLEAARGRAPVFEVEVARCRDLNGWAYTGKGWNHFVALLRQLEEQPDLEYRDSVLRDFYRRFTPGNRQEQLFPEEERELPPLSQGWTLHPWVDSRGVMTNPRESPTTRPGGNHHYGPNSDEFGEREFKQIKQTFRLIQQYGYQPEVFPDGHIQGHFLRKGGDYRFLVNEGQHRMAAVAALGYRVIRCKHNPRFDRVVDFKQLVRWPQVKSGLYSRQLAERVFRHYFESDGRRQAERLGML